MSSAWQALLKGAHAVERDLVTSDDVTALVEIEQGKCSSIGFIASSRS